MYETDNILEMQPSEFLKTCLEWKADMIKEGKWDEIQENIDSNVLRCPVHQFATQKGLCKKTIGGTARCPVCGHYMCPECNSHACDIMSRVTGYLQVVSGWNAPKKQEFKDRKRYGVN